MRNETKSYTRNGQKTTQRTDKQYDGNMIIIFSETIPYLKQIYNKIQNIEETPEWV